VAPSAEGSLTQGKWFRRFIYLKPDVYVVDDFVQGKGTAPTLQWTIGCRSQPTVVGRQLCVGHQDQELGCETLWPPNRILQAAEPVPQAEQGVYPVALEQEVTSGGRGFYMSVT
jgi:hypothetical protein